MSLFKEARDYIHFLRHESEPAAQEPAVTRIPVTSLGLPKVVIVRRGRP